jgi:hypothetical protein
MAGGDGMIELIEDGTPALTAVRLRPRMTT